jgi:hypothetical protein
MQSFWQNILLLIRPGRDLRIDFFRGLALWWIFMDHIPSSPLRMFSLQELSFCDSAELFVLLAGLSAGLVYGRTLQQKGWPMTVMKVLHRVGALYKAHLLLFVLFTAEVVCIAAYPEASSYLRDMNFHPLGSNPYRSIVEIALLRFQPDFLDILPLYIVLLLLFVPMLLILNRPVLLFSLSFTLYLLARFLHLSPPYWVTDWNFNPLMWQLLFVTGLIAAHSPRFRPRRFAWTAVSSVVLAACVVLYHSRRALPALPQLLHIDLAAVDKEGLHPLRLISILALAVITCRLVPAGARWLRSRFASPFILLGQHSLPVFWCGVPLSLLGEFVFARYHGWATLLLIHLFGAAVLLSVAALTAWYAQTGSRQPKNTAVPEINIAGFLMEADLTRKP